MRTVPSIQYSVGAGARREPECATRLSIGLNTDCSARQSADTSRGGYVQKWIVGDVDTFQRKRKASRINVSTRGNECGFTLIEIALSLAVIGFALVAIIGILPTGMNAQKDNRQETIVCQDMSILMDAIRNGAQGVDDLTNYVMAITNYMTDYPAGTLRIYGYTRTNSSSPDPFPLVSGNRIVGLLSTPKYLVASNSTAASPAYTSNYVVAYMRAISGAAFEKYPQTNAEIADAGFQYRMVPEIVPYAYYHSMWTNFNDPALRSPTTNQAEINARIQTQQIVTNRQNNLYDVRLLFRWPYFPLSGNVGAQRQAFRTINGGFLLNTNDNGYPAGVSNLYFFQSRTYVKPS